MHSTELFQKVHKSQGNRFMEMRQQPRQESRWHFVTTSPEHRVFGHGKRSCPGRFFAGNDIKFVLIYLF
jgi:hypothetical protein